MHSRCLVAAAVCMFSCQVTGRSEDSGAEALKYFVGNWTSQVTDKPSKLMPDGANREVLQTIDWTLKKRAIIGREIRSSDGQKSLWLMTNDPMSQTYLFWMFDNAGLLGGQWESTWDDAQKTLTGKATDTPAGWTSHATTRFPDDKSCNARYWMKDDSGALFLDAEQTKTRQPDSAADKIVAAWKKAKPDARQSPESKVLARLIGNWDAAVHSKVAEWTPQESNSTSKISRQSVLDDSFVQDASTDSNGNEGYSLTTYDPKTKVYRSWWWSSEGHRAYATGDWDEAAATLSFKSDIPGGLTSRTTMRFADKNHHDVRVVVTDGDGKVYFDTTWSLTRAK